MGIGDGRETYSDSTLMNLPNTYSGIVKELTEVKDGLIEFEEEKIC